MFSLLRFSIQEVKNLLKVFAISIDLSTFKSFYTQFAIPPVKMNELLQDLLNLDINKSTGTNNIGPLILKVSAPFIVSPLTYIFNRIIDSGIF
jgi:hypothetical protein